MSHRGTSARIFAFCAIALVAALLAPLSAGAAVTTRSAVISRARTWILKGTPYSQTRYAYLDGTLVPSTEPTATWSRLGYRTDCSGYVSMALGFRSSRGYPMSLTTWTLPGVLVRIRKDELQRGDVILKPYTHAVIFVGWLDAKRTRYVGYHESGSGKGAVRSEIDWGTSGFWNGSGYAPYRYPGIDDSVRPPATR